MTWLGTMGGKKLLLRPLVICEILAWADAFRERAGRWPIKESGPIAENPFETWGRVDNAQPTDDLELGRFFFSTDRRLAHLRIRADPRLGEWATGRLGDWPS